MSGGAEAIRREEEEEEEEEPAETEGSPKTKSTDPKTGAWHDGSVDYAALVSGSMTTAVP